jgi:hypothetical protein
MAMGGPADVRLHSDLPDRMFTVDEANALIPALEEIFVRLDPKLLRMRELRELTDDYEAYYGGGIGEAPMVDRDPYTLYLHERSDLDGSIQADIDEVLAFGCEVKDLHRGLIDFPSRIGNEVVYLCWQRGEKGVGWWHTLRGGFAGRKPLAPQSER